MRLNIVARLSRDKDFFFPCLNTIAKLKKNGINCQMNFIGKIYHEDVHDKIINDSVDRDILELVSFTKKSIPISEWTNNTDDYYLNACIGDFVGYSSIDGIKNGFKTLFVNIIPNINETPKDLSFCSDENDLFNLVKKIYSDMESMNKIIEQENKELLQNFYLADNEKELLLNILTGQTL